MVNGSRRDAGNIAHSQLGHYGHSRLQQFSPRQPHRISWRLLATMQSDRRGRGRVAPLRESSRTHCTAVPATRRASIRSSASSATATQLSGDRLSCLTPSATPWFPLIHPTQSFPWQAARPPQGTQRHHFFPVGDVSHQFRNGVCGGERAMMRGGGVDPLQEFHQWGAVPGRPIVGSLHLVGNSLPFGHRSPSFEPNVEGRIES